MAVFVQDFTFLARASWLSTSKPAGHKVFIPNSTMFFKCFF